MVPVRLNVWIMLVGLLLALVPAGCASNDSPALPETLGAPEPAVQMSQIELEDLLIGPADMLEVRVFGVPELGGRYQVDYTGRIKMPLVGEVDAMGLSTFELSNALEEKLAESYLREPSVTVVIDESAESGRAITVEGSVEDPGIFPVEGNLTLLQAIAMAGGPSDTANPRKVVVFRTVDGQRSAAAFDLLAIREGSASDPQVFTNDIIVMDGSEARRNYRELMRSIPLLALFVAL